MSKVTGDGPAVGATMGLRERHKARRRAQILEAARELMRADPDAHLTTEQIARRAEVVPATVYNLIGPREQLWKALAEAFMDRLEEQLAAEPAGAGGDPAHRLRRIGELTVEHLVADPAVSRRMLRGWQHSGGLLRRTPVTHLRAAMGAVREAGLLRDDVDTDAIAAVVGAAWVGALHQWGAGLIDDATCLERSRLAVDVALAAAAAPEHAGRLALKRRS
jgi:AcrR family transcriptional regulator